MKKSFTCLLCSLFLTGLSYAQTKPKTVVKQDPAGLVKLLSGTGLPYKIINDSLAVVPYEEEKIKSFQVFVQGISDLYIIYSNLTETFPGKIDETKYKYLLQQNNHFDIVKIGVSADDNMAYLRADVYKAGTNTPLLKRVIAQVANVTNIIGGDLK